MGHRPSTSSRFLLKVLFNFATLLLPLWGESRARAQSAESLSQMKRAYVESFSQEAAAIKLRERMIKQLRKNRRLQVVAAPKEADAVIRGKENIWVTGYYSTNPRSPSAARHRSFMAFSQSKYWGKTTRPYGRFS
jgi:hypothetical protein